jgi:hypothetical protein
MTAQERREERAFKRAFDLLMSPEADDFARALDMLGWKIVSQADTDGRRWFMNEPSDNCPAWADNECPWLQPPQHASPSQPKPTLRVIDGGRKPEAE